MPKLLGSDELSPLAISLGLSMALSYLRHLEVSGEVGTVERDGLERWALSY